MSLHPDGSLACSGGEDDKAFLWRTSDASVVMECNGNALPHTHTDSNTLTLRTWCTCITGHQDSVTCTVFSHDGKYIATGDMGGGVRVWCVEKRQPECNFESSEIEVLLYCVCVCVCVYIRRLLSLCSTVVKMASTGSCITSRH